jgi:FtsH-binding integral membrane protein
MDGEWDRKWDRTTRRFRTLIAVEVALTIVSLFASVALRRTLPVPLQAYLRADDDAPARALEIAAAVGVALVMAMMAGPTVQTAAETVVYTAWSVVAGVLLSMSYFSELRGKFGIDDARA